MALRHNQTRNDPVVGPEVQYRTFYSIQLTITLELDRIKHGLFYWPGISADVHRRCTAGLKCQLLNPQAIPKALSRPL